MMRFVLTKRILYEVPVYHQCNVFEKGHYGNVRQLAEQAAEAD